MSLKVGFPLFALLLAAALLAWRFDMTAISAIITLATIIVGLYTLYDWSRPKVKKQTEKVRGRLRKEWNDFDAAKPHYPKGKMDEYAALAGQFAGANVHAKAEEKWRIKDRGLLAGIDAGAKSFWAEFDKLLKK